MNQIHKTLTTAGRLLRATALLGVLVAAVVGLPTGLWHFYGWPLPDHIPALSEITAWVHESAAFPTQTALDALVVIAWGLWAVFTTQVALQLPGVAVDAIRCARTPSSVMSAAHCTNLAGRLLTLIAISFLATRGSLATASATTGGSTGLPQPQTVSTAPASGSLHLVRPGESLWDIAESCLGDGNRFREIFTINQHRVQPDGRTMTDPQLIRPGWILTLPEDSAARRASASRHDVGHAAVQSRTAVPQDVPEPPESRTQAEQPHAPRTKPVGQQSPASHRLVAVRLPTGGYVSLTLAAGLAAAYAAARLRSRIRATRCSPAEPLQVVEVPKEPESTLLRAATLLGHMDLQDDPYCSDLALDETLDPDEPMPARRAAAVRSSVAELMAPAALYLGELRGRPVLLHATGRHELELSGPGALDTARAALLSALAAGGFASNASTIHVVSTEADVATLLGEDCNDSRLDRLTVCGSFADALDAVVKGAAGRHRHQLLIATCDPTTRSRSAALLDEARAVSVDLLLLHDTSSQTVAHVGDDGTISASGESADYLDGAEAYRLGLEEARVLFGRLLAGFGERTPPSWPTSPQASPALQEANGENDDQTEGSSPAEDLPILTRPPTTHPWRRRPSP